jgi:hypothetical protein
VLGLGDRLRVQLPAEPLGSGGGWTGGYVPVRGKELPAEAKQERRSCTLLVDHREVSKTDGDVSDHDVLAGTLRVAYRQLAAARPDAFLPDLAGALNNQSNRLADVGRREHALATSTEAVEQYRQLAAARPDGSSPSSRGR